MVRHVAKLFRSADGSSRVAVLDDIDLDIQPGEVVALLGRRWQRQEHPAAVDGGPDCPQ
jgi:predicted ABC-type transport system involved in lysophospholipase L1 biosynthesis ATPase subunit